MEPTTDTARRIDVVWSSLLEVRIPGLLLTLATALVTTGKVRLTMREREATRWRSKICIDSSTYVRMRQTTETLVPERCASGPDILVP